MQPQPETEQELRWSLLDRLLDDPETGVHDSSDTPTLRKWQQALLRDVEALLNTRRPPDELPEEYRFTSASILNYGLPDFTAVSITSPSDQNHLRRVVEDALRRFEPRLASISVTKQPSLPTEPVLRFRVEAWMRTGTDLEPIQFETVLQADSRQFTVFRKRA